MIEGAAKEPVKTAWLDVGRNTVNRPGLAVAPAPSESEMTTAEVTWLIAPLTNRELEVLRLLAAGARNRDIARELVVTLETVKKHVSHILSKLGAASRTRAVAHAHRLGLIEGDPANMRLGAPVSIQSAILVNHLCVVATGCSSGLAERPSVTGESSSEMDEERGDE